MRFSPPRPHAFSLSAWIMFRCVCPRPVSSRQVKDVTSDIAVLSRQGSKLVVEYREKRDRSKMRNRFWELGGSKMGDAMGIKAAPTEEEEAAAKKAAEAGACMCVFVCVAVVEGYVHCLSSLGVSACVRVCLCS